MKIFITGGTGFVGTTLMKSLSAKGHEVSILTRSIKKGQLPMEGVAYIEGDPSKAGKWQESVAEHDSIINLAGASIFSRWSDNRKRELKESRIATTANLVEAIKPRRGKETHLLSTSAVGYYGYHEDEVLYEQSPAGMDFLATLAADWEMTARKAEDFGVRVVLCRFGIVLGKKGGALGKMTPAFKLWMGSTLGTGKQWLSWIHEDDLADIFLFLLEKKDISGPVNCVAPNPVRNKDMTAMLGKVMGKPTFLPPVSSFFVKMILGEMGDVLLKGQRAYPQTLTQQEFTFTFPTLEGALRNILGK
ncbi:MAG: TIGR01777 family oxidoreductase [Deltaproteobacteria bacterium]|nr:TIGR01777 family oxidoreductase [Deltaproteobacteria bacterium]